MKILSVTDCHGAFKNLLEVFELERPEVVICTGDYTKEVEDLALIKENIDFYIVRGNCDYDDYKNKDELIFNIKNKKIFITHGHLYGVKSAMGLLENKAEELEVDLVLFGHTHIPYDKVVKGIRYFNPGAMIDGRYGIIEIQDNLEATIQQKRLNQ